jgi:hypothetical protein
MLAQVLIAVYFGLCNIFNNLLLLIFNSRIKIDNLKGKVSPIYKLYAIKDTDTYYEIEKFDLEWTCLDLEWCVPFSVLFEKRAYVSKGVFDFIIKNLDEVTDTASMWEEQYNIKNAEKLKNVSKKEKFTNRLKELNKVFNENYI